MDCHRVSGGCDYLLKVIAAGRVDDQTIMERLLDRDVGIDRYVSYVVIKSPFVKQRLRLDSIFAEKF